VYLEGNNSLTPRKISSVLVCVIKPAPAPVFRPELMGILILKHFKLLSISEKMPVFNILKKIIMPTLQKLSPVSVLVILLASAPVFWTGKALSRLAI